LDFLLHWSVGFILGTLIALPFITGRWIYDYDAHKWVQVRWGPVVDKITARRLGISSAELATPELYPLTSSRFIIYHLIIANACAVLALVPDLGIFTGNGNGDHGLWADLFFFHATIDKLPASTGAAMGPYLFIIALLVWLIVVTIAMGMQNDSECKESVVY
jgi:hypothetical protein